MQTLQNIFDQLWAALMFFTRLPWWRIYSPQQDAFRHVVNFWPFVGWITGGTLAITFYAGIHFLTLPIVALLVICARIMLTGALHEDGLADFFDGMGGGHTRERILEIMKDSHIGTYGVIGLISYFILFYFGLRELVIAYLNNSIAEMQGDNPLLLIICALFTIDIWSKSCASFLIIQLPYVRKEEEAKCKLRYTNYKWYTQLVRIVFAMLPVVILWHFAGKVPPVYVFVSPVIVELLLMLWLHKKLGGYTGDCCGATLLLCESSMLLTWLICM